MTFALPDNLPSIANAQLPSAYLAAKDALAVCNRIDECKDWADKSAALASYAKQADDDELEKFALRVRARAIRRCGELLQTFEKQQVQRTDLQPCSSGEQSEPPESRSAAAREFGLKSKTKNNALRLANIPAADFDAAIESDDPPTISDLAERGTKKNPLDIGDRDPADFRAATEGLGTLSEFVKLTRRLDSAAIVRGCNPRERALMRQNIATILPWITALTDHIEEAGNEEANITQAAQSHRH